MGYVHNGAFWESCETVRPEMSTVPSSINTMSIETGYLTPLVSMLLLCVIRLRRMISTARRWCSSSSRWSTCECSRPQWCCQTYTSRQHRCVNCLSCRNFREDTRRCCICIGCTASLSSLAGSYSEMNSAWTSSVYFVCFPVMKRTWNVGKMTVIKMKMKMSQVCEKTTSPFSD